MRRSLRVIVFVIPLVLLGTLVGTYLHAQGNRPFTDFRGRSDYTEEDLSRALFGQPASDVRTRGIGPAPQTAAPTPAPSGQAVALNVFFEFNSDKIVQSYYDDLDKLGKVLMSPQHNGYRVQVEGHTDSIGSDSYNQRLSVRRAASVKRYLVQHFPIPSERLVVQGFGEGRPIASNDTDEGREKNRRVEVVNLGMN